MARTELSDRSRRILATLVQEYIETGEPVASQVLARRSGLGVSSATVRNVLARLDAGGYVHQPHTSAGRVPTDPGYRVFVDQLLEAHRPGRAPATVESHLREEARRSPFVGDLLATATHVVSRAVRHVGFALADHGVAILERVEFVRLEGSRVLVVVLTRGNQITQKVVDAGEPVRPEDLVQAANYLNSEFAGRALVDVRDAVRARLAQERTLYDQLLGRALRLARQTLEELPRQQAFHVEGAASLLEDADGVSLGTLRALLEMMEEKERLVHLLNQYIDGPGLTVVIGTEHAAPDLRPFSLIASTTIDEGAVRTVGVIGPRRMHYSRAISLVDGTTRVVSRMLRHAH